MLKLKYAFNPSPNPIVVSVPGLPASVVGVSVVITNPTPSAVALAKIQIVIPVGDESARCLSASPDLPYPVAGSLAGWTASASGSTVTLLPTGDVGTITDMLSFTLPGITVNETPGTVSVTISETPPSGPKQVDGSYSLQKVSAADVPVTNFWAAPAVITEPDQPAVLYWTCSGQGDDYVYSLVSDAGWQPVNCLGAGNCYTCADGANGITTPLIQQTTTFTLQVIQASQGHRSVVATLQTTVAVTVPYFSSDWYADQSEVGSGTLARLHWLAFNTGHCQLLMDGRTVDGAAPTDTLRDGYAVIVPGDGAPHQFTVVAWPSQGDARATLPFPEMRAGAAPAVATGAETTAGAVAVTPDNRLALVCSATSNVVTVIDVQTGVPEPGLIETGMEPLGIAVTPDSARALVTLGGDNAVQVIDVPARKADPALIAIPGQAPTGIAITPDGRLALVACNDSDQVFVVDVAARVVQGPPISVPSNPSNVAITPDGALALVTCTGAGVVQVIDIATRTAEPAAIPVGFLPAGIAVTPDGRLALVVNMLDGVVTVVDIAARTAEPAKIPVGSAAAGVAVVRGGRYALVASPGKVTVIDVPGRAALAPAVSAGSAAGSIAVSPDGLLGFSTNWDACTVSLV